MIDRELLEKRAVDAICACQYYDLADNMDCTTDGELLDIIEGRYTCEMCGE